jgi:molybdopterin molybdotransferase
MLELEDALAQILAALPTAAPETISTAQAHGRVLAEKISAPIDLPAFDNSSVDGYAVRAQDTATAQTDAPVRLKLIGKVAAGEQFQGNVGAGECIRIFTGSPMPRGADAIVMQEDTRVDDGEADGVQVVEPVKPWENIRFRGEDVKRGAILMEPGVVITAGRIALLAASGRATVPVGRRPLVGLLATGSELREAGEALAPGQIYESNRPALAPLVRRCGGISKIFPIAADSPVATRAALELAFAECDLLVTCGGVSVGELDFVKPVFEQLGGRLQFWKVAIKPGRPFVFGRRGEKFLFGLPGNPVSAFVTFLLLVRPALLRWQGAADVFLPAHHGMLAEPLANPGGRRHFLRVTIDGVGKVRPAGVQGSHLLSSLAAADGLVDVPPRTTLPPGTSVRVLCWESGG